MNFLNRWKVSFLAAAVCVGAVFGTPMQAQALTRAERAAAEALQAEIDARYNKEIESNSWESWPAGPQVYSEAAIVMEASTGTILYAKSIDEQHYPASITKIMTVLLALENCEMDEEVTFSHNAVYSIDYGSSSIARDEGEVLTVEECLYAIMLESANECANAIAEHISGSVEAFADLMNQRAAELGCTGTHFVNPSGLPNDEHYTTSHDMALITREAISHEAFRKISGTSRYVLRATNKKSEELTMSNHHYMICGNRSSKYLDDTVFAGKTGYTSAALNTLVTCATRNGMDLIVVTMRTQGTGEQGVPLYTDTANLLNYATENFQKLNISENETNFTIGQNALFDTGTSIFHNTSPMIEMGTDGYVVLPSGVDFSSASPSLEFVDQEDSPVIAVLRYQFAGQTIGSTELTLADSSLQEFNFQSTGEEDESGAAEDPSADSSSPRLIKINLRVISAVGVALLVLVVLILLGRRLTKLYHFNLRLPSFLRRTRADRNSFSSPKRRRYKSWKRRRKKWFK